MIHENPGHLYRNEFAKRTPTPDDYALYYVERSVLLIGNELPHFSQLHCDMNCAQYMFEMDGAGYYLIASLEKEVPGAEMMPIDQFRNLQPQHAGFAGITGSQLHRFYRDNAFCGRCGGSMEKSGSERAMCCPACRNTIYPKISPAVIVAVTDGDRILLTKYAGRVNARHALVAGFCEFGEPAEDTVHREVMEEVGLRVKNIRYYASQPWSFSDSLLLGFFCEVDGATTVALDDNELCEGTWFHRDDVPPPESLMSLTATMIDAFRRNAHGTPRSEMGF